MLDNLTRKLSRYWKIFINSFWNKDSSFFRKPQPNEPITIFATHESDYRADGTARHSPFMPSNKYQNTSCFRIINLSAPEIWKIGDDYVIGDNIKSIYGRFDLLAKSIYSQKLRFDPDNTPRRHANIIGWQNNREAQKNAALQIAAESLFNCQIRRDAFVAQVTYDKDKKRLSGVVLVKGKEVHFHSGTVKDLSNSMINAIENREGNPP